MTVVSLDDSLDWSDFDIPGGSTLVRLATLRVERPSRARVVLVRFPPGWERAEEGSYECAEELVMLDGALTMSGEIFRPGDWAFVPAAAPRVATAPRPQALVLARFDGPARWHTGPSQAREPTQRGRLEQGAAPSPLGSGTARLLRGGEPSSWWCDAPEAGRPSPANVEILSPSSRSWAWVAAGEPFPRLDGPCFCRTFSAGGAS